MYYPSLLIYNILITLLFPVLWFIYALKALFNPQRQHEVLQKFGWAPVQFKTKTIWLHAVSVGEILLAEKFFPHLQKDFPNHQLIVTTSTKEAWTLGQKKFPAPIKTIFFPFDFYWTINKYLQAIAPDFIIVLETEIWPNFLHQAHQKKIPLFQANGIIGSDEFRNYKIFGFFFKPLLAKYTHIFAQRKIDYERFLQLGAQPANTSIAGNIKYDLKIKSDKNQIKELKKIFALKRGEFIIVAGSTHKGEEKILIENFVRAAIPKSRLIIAPRHLERTPEINHLVPGSIKCAWRSQKNCHQAPIIILDTIGELLSAYYLADLVFMGGTYTWQGHNIIEPAYLAKPIVLGPHMANFSEIFAEFSQAQAVAVVEEPQNLYLEWQKLYKNTKTRQNLAKRAQKLVQKNQGIVPKIHKQIVDLAI
jgi:3-deoxy-D-manno-octulosonic-acid transferase